MSTNNNKQSKQAQAKQSQAETQKKQQQQAAATEVKQEVVETTKVETPVVEQAQKQEVAADPEPAAAPVATEEKEIVVPESAKAVVKAISEYAEAMAPNVPVDAKLVARQQVKMNHTLTVLLEQTPADKFNEVFGHALLEVEKHLKGAFSDRLLFRGMDNIQLPSAQVAKLQAGLLLLTEAAPAKDRARRMKNIDLNVTLKGYSEPVRAKVQAFFKK